MNTDATGQTATTQPARRTRALNRLRDRAFLRFIDRVGFIVLVTLGLALGVGYAIFGIRPTDADIFWRAGHQAHYYGTTWGADAASLYVYTPPLAQIVGLLPFEVYLVGWMTLIFAGFWAATRSWSLLVFGVSAASLLVFGLVRPLTSPIALSTVGNPQVLVAAVCVLGFRHPALWSFVLLTKITPGIGLLWFAVRREWRSLAIAVGATVLIVAVSFVLAPAAWADFLRFATTNAGAKAPQPVVPIPFLARLPMSAALIVWGALTNRRWTVPIAAGWASVALYEWSYLAVWIAALPLLGPRPVTAALKRRADAGAGSTRGVAGRP